MFLGLHSTQRRWSAVLFFLLMGAVYGMMPDSGAGEVWSLPLRPPPGTTVVKSVCTPDTAQVSLREGPENRLSQESEDPLYDESEDMQSMDLEDVPPQEFQREAPEEIVTGDESGRHTHTNKQTHTHTIPPSPSLLL
eukprot:2102818-Rhodomonas_salina.2